MRLFRFFLAWPIGCILLAFGILPAYAAPALTNGDFSAGLVGWTTANGPGSSDPSVVWTLASPGGASDPIVTNGMSGGPASRVIYQDFVVPVGGIGTAGFTFDYYSTNVGALNSNTFTTFDNAPPGENGTRIDIMLPTVDVFTGPVLFTLFEPTDAVPVALPTALGTNTFADPAALTAFLNANAGSTLRLRIGNREEDFSWSTGFDNLSLELATPAAAIPTLSEWALLMLAGLTGLFGVGAMRRSASGRPA